MSPGKAPRTKIAYFVLIPVLLVSCAGLTIGLTFAPCYSSMCIERYFPYRTRIHLAFYYSFLTCIAIFLAARTWFKPVRNISERLIIRKALPLVGKRLSVGGILLLVFIAGAVFGSTGYWYTAQLKFWTDRGAMVNWTEYTFRLAWTGTTGHWCDILLGLVVIPVGRNSVLSKVFHLNPSTLLLAHKLLSYTLLAGVVTHGLVYFSFLAATLVKLKTDSVAAGFFSSDNPVDSWEVVYSRNLYYQFVLPTGLIAGWFLLPIIIITALPILRRNNFNVFYFTHIVAGFCTMVLVCMHSSTNFYCLLPGLLLWMVDWSYRIRNSLWKSVDIQLEGAGDGWYRMRLPASLGATAVGPDVAENEKGAQLMAPHGPLATYYIRVRQASKLQLHPFSAVYAPSLGNQPTVILRKGPEKKKAKKRDKEWTWKLAALADQSERETITLKARIEGPYSHSIPEMYGADHIIIIVGGSGVTGGISIANWWAASCGSTNTSSSSLRLLWTVRDRASSQLQEVQELLAFAEKVPNMDVRVSVSAEDGRIRPEQEVANFVSPAEGRRGKAWAYVCGPQGLMTSAETALVERRSVIQKDQVQDGVSRLDWFVSNYEV